ncbi:mannose-1-phosphate guanylyltransferase/mannose-6-phosphate isomerase [Marinobacterium marinum]|uniref:mannose-1-phosphate guanylyltransferase n=1 Tax=Marinobacterium marinum TaxID=2756129 RepID=A0A7W1WY70_9GAMM|nr:mannose-1-phosphate guanylyltransferase/mannose-6-phosphate isomerase [Marinobacterium marinum]MBA4502420.1 mannose-1-phosphate guanylyltransferase/mannose-6-phosphate isomerase [Marinobacterium marinum]
MQAVILAGGTGSRLWPLSRQHYPKQFLALNGQDSLLQQCLHRAADLCRQPALLVGQEEHRFLLAQQLQESGLEGRIILEPEGRNTAASLTLAALACVERGNDDELLLVLPADQRITPIDALLQAIKQAETAAHTGHFCVFGLPPSHPHSGYGYILAHPGGLVERFVEKPDTATAAQLIASGALWNSGLLLCRADTWLAALSQRQPELFNACSLAWQQKQRDLDFIRIQPDAFRRSPSVSIDYAVLEHEPMRHCTRLEVDWQDLGSWEALITLNNDRTDEQGCLALGDTLLEDCRDTAVFGEHRLITGIGLERLLVVDTPDALLLAHRDQMDAFTPLLQRLAKQQRSELKLHPRVYRPWGWHETLTQGPGFKVKTLSIKPGESLSLQRHRHRAEHWIVLAGTAHITRGDQCFDLSANASTFIAQGEQHRLQNRTSAPLLILEVQSGEPLDEDDIERLEDRYGRT